MHPPVGVFYCSLGMACKPQIASGESDAAAAAAANSTSLRGRRCRSTSYISDLADSVTNSHIDQLFCTAQQQQQQQPDEDEDGQRSSSDVSSSYSCRHQHSDDEMTPSDGAESRRRRPTLDEMFCTQRSTIDNGLRPPSVTDPAQRCSASSEDSVKKQVRSDMLQLVKSATSDVRRLCHQMKRNKVRSPSDTSHAAYPRQPLTVAVDQSCRTDSEEDRSQSLVAT